jgi:hypothetical protein
MFGSRFFSFPKREEDERGADVCKFRADEGGVTAIEYGLIAAGNLLSATNEAGP